MNNDNARIIECTFSNLAKIYVDVAALLNSIEQGIQAEGYQAIADSGSVTWENSTALSSPKDWFARFFSRSYRRNQDQAAGKQVGYCLHLGGYADSYLDYLRPQFDKEEPLLPLLSVACLYSVPLTAQGNVLKNAYWSVGTKGNCEREQDGLVSGTLKEFGISAYHAYFLDPLIITNNKLVSQLVLQPMKALYEKAEKADLSLVRNHMVRMRPQS